MVEINFKCSDCDFSFKDKNLIFYIDSKDESKSSNNLEELLNEKIDNLILTEEGLNKENSDKMSKSLIAGFLYENYCPNCNELIKSYIPEDNNLFSNIEIEKILKNEILKNSDKSKNKSKTNFKILFFDFKNTFYKDRRNTLENNTCPNCDEKMSLVISEKIPCPKCGGKLIEEF